MSNSNTGDAGGDVVGPASSTDNAVARFDGTDGKLLQDSGIIVDDSDNMTGVNSLTLTTDLSVANGGTGASTLTGVLTGNGTSAITAATVTQYGVLVGGASNAVASTAVGTAAQVLTSNGAGVAPTFQTAGGGIMVQQVYGVSVTAGSTTSNILLDNSIPQITEGAEVITVTITPTSDSNILVIEANGPFTNSTTNPVVIAIFQDATAGALAATSMQFESSDTSSIYIQHRMVSGTASATTFRLRYGRGANTGTVYANGDTGGRVLGGVAETWIKVTELTV